MAAEILPGYEDGMVIFSSVDPERIRAKLAEFHEREKLGATALTADQRILFEERLEGIGVMNRQYELEAEQD